MRYRTQAAPPAEPLRLRSPLARLCLPQETRDPHRHLAWANSVCAVIVVLGAAGLLSSREHRTKPARPVAAVLVPVTLTELTTPQAKTITTATETRQNLVAVEMPVEAPPVATAVFPKRGSIPLVFEGGVEIAPMAEMAIPAEPHSTSEAPGQEASETSWTETVKEPEPVQFNPQGQPGGFFPSPRYPALAVRNRWEGTVGLLMEVGASGSVVRVELRKSSGYGPLDDAALGVVKNRWRFPAGERRIYLWDCTFRIQ
jgi:protein TonB